MATWDAGTDRRNEWVWGVEPAASSACGERCSRERLSNEEQGGRLGALFDRRFRGGFVGSDGLGVAGTAVTEVTKDSRKRLSRTGFQDRKLSDPVFRVRV